jgi:hypothetical protein
MKARGHQTAPTPLREWRWKRNLVMLLAWRHGAPQEILADAFDLSQAQVSRIVSGDWLVSYCPPDWIDPDAVRLGSKARIIHEVESHFHRP